jgi:hypothetical protein
MTGQKYHRQLLLIISVIGLWLVQAGPAAAATQAGREQLGKHFAGLGKVEYELYAPLGGPEMGAAVIRDGSGIEMRVVELKNGTPTSRLSKRMDEYNGKRPFTFLLTGMQFLSYPTKTWTSPDGKRHDIGDLTIYDMRGDTPIVVYELKNVTDLFFQAYGALTASNLIWQPADHYLNTPGIYPIKYDYFNVRADENGQYEIVHHLEMLEDIGLVEAARYNNRGVFFYDRNNLENSIAAFSKANISTDRDQSVILRNTDYVKSEMTDLEYQASHNPDDVVDDARMYYWTGQYQPALRVLETRQRRMTDSDFALSALCMANLKRWPEADNITAVLKQRGVPWLGDYMADLLNIAELQGLPRVLEVQMRAMEALDPTHPALAAIKARLLIFAKQDDAAQRLLESYLFANRPNRDVSEAIYELYGIYFNASDSVGMERLQREAQQGELTNLKAYVNLHDYRNFDLVLEELQVDTTEWIKAPRKGLDDMTIK